MGKKLYVKGGILIDTPYFACHHCGCLFAIQPEGTEILETNCVIKNRPYLKIDNKNPQSIFNEYYARDGLTSLYAGAEFYYKSYDEAYNDYLLRIQDIKELITIEGLNKKQRIILNRLSYLNIVASLETFICDTALTRITGAEDVFMCFFNRIPGGTKKDGMQRMKDQNRAGQWEQSVIDYVIRTSYSNICTIENLYEKDFGFSVSEAARKMENIFTSRHKLAHRNGRGKDGSYITISNEDLDNLISDSKKFIDQILEKIMNMKQ